MQQETILFYGYGNPGREDDGLGPAFIQLLEDWLKVHPQPMIATDSNYQLNIEDAAAIANKKLVVFVDATLEDIDNYSFTKVEPSDARVEFSMHAVSPSFVLDLCKKLYHQSPETWLLHIKGYEWGFVERLSVKAEQNLHEAFDFIVPFLLQRAASFSEQN